MNSDIFVSNTSAGGGWLGIGLGILTCASTLAGVILLWRYTLYTKRYTAYTKQLAELTQAALKEARASNEAMLAETRRSNDATEKSNEIAELSRRSWLIIVTLDDPSGIPSPVYSGAGHGSAVGNSYFS